MTAIASYFDTRTSDCVQSTASTNQCFALVTTTVRCRCRRVSESNFCEFHRPIVMHLIHNYSIAEKQRTHLNPQWSLDHLHRSDFVGNLPLDQCHIILKLLYSETLNRNLLFEAYYNDASWGRIDVINRDRQFLAIKERHKVIALLEKRCANT
jgi:hypothetical protein